jgi:hypothetical protein
MVMTYRLLRELNSDCNLKPPLMLKNCLLILTLGLVCASCTDVSDQADSSRYFNISAFFTEYAGQLNEQMIPVQKTIEKDGEREEKFLENPDWRKELEPFKDLNIQRPAFRNEFLIDTLFSHSASEYKITYTAKSKNTEIRKIEISFLHDEIQTLSASKLNDNAVFSTGRNLAWKRGKGYKISGFLEIGNFYSARYKIEGIYSTVSKNTGA